jgi:hypothetical protein
MNISDREKIYSNEYFDLIIEYMVTCLSWNHSRERDYRILITLLQSFIFRSTVS